MMWNCGFVRRRSPGRKNEQGGFTLIELLVVLAILAALVVVFTIGALLRASGKKDVALAASDLNAARSATGQYMIDMSAPPSQLLDLWINPGSTRWRGEYVPPKAGNVWNNPWDEPYALVQVLHNGTPRVVISTTVPVSAALALDKNFDRTESADGGVVLNATAAAGAELNITGTWPTSGNVSIVVLLDTLAL